LKGIARKLPLAAAFMAVSTFGFGETWTGKLVDAFCKASSEAEDSSAAGCTATPATHLFAIELSDANVLSLDAVGNEKAANALKSVQKTNPRAIVTGSLEGPMLHVETIEVQ
jgi:hypothetical protein